MPQPSPDIDAFIERVQALPAGPGVSLDAVLQPSLDTEKELRTLFATDRQNARIANPYVGLVDVFEAPDAIKTTRARVIQGDLTAKYVMPIPVDERRAEGSPCMVADLEEFKKNWAIFTEGSLSQLFDWNNVVAAGGSVLACLNPLSEEDKASKRTIRRHYHTEQYPTSDVDLFLWGMNAEQAEAKVKTIYEAVRDSVPWDVTCLRTKHTISIHSQYPYRSVQIVLRLYHSPAEILAGFDIDAPCCAYDGKRVWASPRAVVAMMRQCNTTDVTRRSPSYEVRLAKYSSRSYEIYVPTLERNKIDPTIYERSIAKMEGLARLLVLEKLTNDNQRDRFLTERRDLRGRPKDTNRRNRRRNKQRIYKGDLKTETGLGLEMNDYDVASLHIPYGPGWDARRIEKLVYQTDLGMNSTFNPKNKGRRLHRHPAFFGTIEECIEDCCEHCPSPIDEDERKLQGEEDEIYIRGRIKFMEENPGQQNILTGSFNPINEGEWQEQVYIKPTEQLFIAIAANDRATVLKLLEDTENINVNNRDHVGRTTLHVAIISRNGEIAEDLIEAGARITARLADGKAALHLAAQYDLPRVVKKLLERSEKNKKELEAKTGKNSDDDDEDMDADKTAAARNSSEDDWSSHDDEDVVMSEPEDDADDEDEDDDDSDEVSDGEKKQKKKEKSEEPTTDEVPEDETEEPDIIEINITDWDIGFSALCYAVLFASPATLTALIEGGADVASTTNPSIASRGTPVHPLTLTLIRENEDEGSEMAKLLIKAGATSSTANGSMLTIFHMAVALGHTKIVETILCNDPNAKKVLDFPTLQYRKVVFPLSTALAESNYGLMAVLLAHGVKTGYEESDISNAADTADSNVKNNLFGYGAEVKNYLQLTTSPVEAALSRREEIVKLLINLGAAVNIPIHDAYADEPARKRTIRDYVEWVLNEIQLRIRTRARDEENRLIDLENRKKNQPTPVPVVKPEEPEVPTNRWLAFHQKHREMYSREQMNKLFKGTSAMKMSAVPVRDRTKEQEDQRLLDAKAYFEEVLHALDTVGAKSWKDVYPDVKTTAVIIRNFVEPPLRQVIEQPKPVQTFGPIVVEKERKEQYIFLSSGYGGGVSVPEHLAEAYDDLFEACYLGDNKRIEHLCLPVSGQAVPGGPKALCISVRMKDQLVGGYDYRKGYTPLYAAIAGRKWSTAKLILAIAAAQYHPEDEGEEKIKFDTDIHMDSDEEDDYDSDASDITIEQKQVTFIDIATRPSEVKSQCHPRELFNVEAPWTKPKPSKTDDVDDNLFHGWANPIDTAITFGDLESFVHIANLYESLDKSIEMPAYLLTRILRADLPDILDEYIRRTGAGIDVAGAQKESGVAEPVPVATNDENKIYLGLNFHGKKRTDLARANDPNAGSDEPTYSLPVLWNAETAKALKCIEYLASRRPLEAYRFYANTRSDSKALWLKKIGTDLDKWLPSWLGWKFNALGESPISTGVLAHSTEVLNLIEKLEPKLASQGFKTTIKFLGLNPLQLAVRCSPSIEMFDYLLSRGVSPAEKDSIKGWNILHEMCYYNHNGNNSELLEHALNKVPRDVCETLLAQKSKGRENTPLLLAVKQGYIRCVELVLKFSNATVLIPDVDGQTPLHIATTKCHSMIVKLLVDAAPLKALYIENSVGITPLDIIGLKQLTAKVDRLNTKTNQISRSDATVDVLRFNSQPDVINEYMIGQYEAQFSALRNAVEDMVDRGTVSDRMKNKIKLEATKWIEKTQIKVRIVKERKEKREAEEEAERERLKKESGVKEVPQKKKKDPVDTGNLNNTYVFLNGAKAHAPEVPRRQLIRLLDVQQSVHATLVKVNREIASEDDYEKNNEEKKEDPDDEENILKKFGLVFRHGRTYPDSN